MRVGAWLVAIVVSAAVCVCGARGQSNPAGLSEADLEELLAPIALYPDTLLANILAASVYPEEVADAARAAKSRPSAERIDAQPWEAAVKAVARVPEVIKMMGEYPDWTAALGQAYLTQSQDVLAAVQSLRARAWENGALQTTEEQVVETSGDTIIIEPADPEIIYVPSYPPDVVYVDHHDDDVWAAGLIGFGTGLTLGLILDDIDCDWDNGHCSWGDVDVDIDNEINIDNDRVNIGDGRPRPGQEGGAWRPNSEKVRPSTGALDSYRGAGAGGRTSGKVPGRKPGAQPIASRPAPKPSARPSTRGAPGATRAPTSANRAVQAPSRPNAQPTPRPQRPPTSGPSKKPAIPPAPPSTRPSGGSRQGAAPSRGSSRPSGYSGGGSGRRAASSRGSGSRGAAGRGGGGRGGGRRG